MKRLSTLMGSCVLGLALTSTLSGADATDRSGSSTAQGAVQRIQHHGDDHCDTGNHCCTADGQHDCEGPARCIGTPCQCTLRNGHVEHGRVCHG